MATAEEAYGDVLEICALLQCIGFSVKSLDNTDTNASQDGIAGGTKSVVINCQTSGLRVVMEGGSQLCSCPLSNLHTSGFWQVSAITGGKKRDTESGSSILASLPKEFRDQLSRELRELVKSIRGHNESQHLDTSTAGNPNSMVTENPMGNAGIPDNPDTSGNPGTPGGNLGNPGTPAYPNSMTCSVGNSNNMTNEQAGPSVPGKITGAMDMPNSGVLNRSVSNVELKTTPPQKGKINLKADTPTRYRSLDTLTNRVADPDLPMPGPLAKPPEQARPSAVNRLIYQRQNTYNLESPDSARGSNRTSSPIRQMNPGQMILVNMLLEAEGAADKLRERLTDVIKVMAEESLLPVDTSVSSMALDVSKISVVKGNEGTSQYASSPNIRSQPTDPALRPRANLFESVSTLNLAPKKTVASNTASAKTSRLRKFSPTIFKRRESPSVSDRAGRLNDGVRSCPRPRIVTPVQRTPKPDTSSNKSVCSSLKKKYGHIKSTIPRFTGKNSPAPTPDKA